jgi:hypothetical protein
MKARIIVLMLMAGLIMNGNQASAQLKSLLKDKALDALNKTKKKEETKTDPKKNVTTQTQQQQPQQNPAGNALQKKMMGMMGMNNVKYETVYNFTSSMSMEMQSTDSLGKQSEKVLYTTFFDKNSKSFAMEFKGTGKQEGKNDETLMIFDYKNWAMLMLGDKGDGKKSGMAFPMAKDSTIEAQQKNPTQQTKATPKDLSSANMYYKATGRSKSIAGYNCKEYIYENAEGKGEVWATNDVVFDYSKAYGQMGGMSAFATGGTTYGLGMVMEMHFADKHSKAKTDMTVTDIKPSNPKSLNLAGYQIIGLGGQPPK